MRKEFDPPPGATWAGIAKGALLPGMTYFADMFGDLISEIVREAMHSFIEEFRNDFASNGAAKKRGRPARQGSVREHIEETASDRRKAILGKKGDERTTAHGWSTDPEERKREMARRRAKAKGITKVIGLHPRDPNHPGHQAWLKKMSKVGKRSWANLTPEQREERQRKMRAAKVAA